MPKTETHVIIRHTTRAAYNLDKYCSLDYVDTPEEDFFSTDTLQAEQVICKTTNMTK